MSEKKQRPTVRYNKNKTTHLQIRISPDLKSRYAVALEYLDMTATDHLTSCISELIERADKKKRTEDKHGQ